jgi:acetyl-CoA carboxylase carboxyltransferase component
VAALKSRGEKVTPEEEKNILDEITQNYFRQTTPYYAAARLWVDAIIDPAKTRQVISEGINAADHNPSMEDFKTGVFQV